MNFRTIARTGVLPILFLIISGAQQSPSLADSQLAKEAARYYDGGHQLQALPLYEQLVTAEPNNSLYLERLGACMLAQTATLSGDAARNQLLRARNVLLQAQKNGDNSGLLLVLLEEISPDGTYKGFSDQPAADAAVKEGEAAFVKADYDSALDAYRQALVLDPKNQPAMLFIGDCYFRKGDYLSANEWYKQAAEANPNDDAAFRFWADSLLHLHRNDEARDRLIDAILANPYRQAPWQALMGYAQTTHIKLAFPRISLGSNVSQGEKGGTNVTIDASALTSNPGIMAVAIIYAGARTDWQKSKFAQQFPNEKQYRHSLPEEHEALSTVLDFILAGNKDKQGRVILTSEMAMLKRINDDGLLDAFILLARADAGIAQDYLPYRSAHADLLRRFVLNYIIQPS